MVPLRELKIASLLPCNLYIVIHAKYSQRNVVQVPQSPIIQIVWYSLSLSEARVAACKERTSYHIHFLSDFIYNSLPCGATITASDWLQKWILLCISVVACTHYSCLIHSLSLYSDKERYKKPHPSESNQSCVYTHLRKPLMTIVPWVYTLLPRHVPHCHSQPQGFRRKQGADMYLKTENPRCRVCF